MRVVSWSDRLVVIVYTVICFALSATVQAGGASDPDETLSISIHQVYAGNCVSILCPLAPGATKRESMIVDCGSLGGSDIKTEVVSKVVDLVKQSNSLTLVLTHPDRDHYNFIKDILKDTDKTKTPLKAVFYGGYWESYAQGTATEKTYDAIENFANQNTRFYGHKEGNQSINSHHEMMTLGSSSYQCGAANMKFLAAMDPTDIPLSNPKGYNINGSSLILKLSYLDWAVLLPGDANGPPIQYSLDNQKALLDSDVILVPHHGSNTHGSMNDLWVKAVDPEILIVSAGGSQKRERDHNPNSDLLDVYLTQMETRSRATMPSHSVEAYNDVLGDWEMLDTTEPLFSTLEDGDIRVEIDNVGGEGALEVTCPETQHPWCKDGISNDHN